MAKRKAGKRSAPARKAKRPTAKRRAAKRPIAKRPTAQKAKARKKTAKKSPLRKAPARRAVAKAPVKPKARASAKTQKAAAPAKVPRLDRVRRTLDEPVKGPPSSLNMDRHGSAARTGRAEMAESLLEHHGMSPDITGGDVDVDVEDAYFTGDEAPGGDNPSPDLEVVDDIGKALGIQYEDNEELKGADKVTERDKHRWEMDPASSEDYKDRK